MFNFKKYDLVAIGDTVTDAFIRLIEAHLNCKINNEACEICMKFGDKIPYELVEICPAVGNSANAAVSASRLGLSAAIVTNLGEDQNGTDALRQFKKENVATKFIKTNRGMKTNYHYVLWFESDRTILIKHEKFPYALSKIKAKYIYLSSLGEHSLSFHSDIAKYLEQNPDVKLVFQPGTFQIRFGKEALTGIYKRTEIFFCNVEEAEIILGVAPQENNAWTIKELTRKIGGLGPKIVVLTDGPKGAYAYQKETDTLYFMPPYPDPKLPYERTGAGDAFASTFTCAIIQGKKIEEALMWAPINSMSVVQQIGAQKGLLTLPQLSEYLRKSPPDYKPRVV